MNFDNVTIIILGLIVVAVASLVYGNQDVLLMVVSGLLGFLAKDKLPQSTGYTESTKDNVESEDDVQ